MKGDQALHGSDERISEPPTVSAVDARQRVMWLVAAGVSLSIPLVLIISWLYWVTGIWQLLLMVAGVLVGLLFVAADALRVWRTGERPAPLLSRIAPVVACSSVALALSGLSLLVAVVCVTMVLLVGLFVPPRNRVTPFAISCLFFALVALLHFFPPVPRFPVDLYPAAYAWAGGTAALAILLVGCLGSGFHWRFGSIRTRLIVACVLLTLLPAGAAAVIWLAIDFRAGEQRTADQLESLAAMKEEEIRLWIRSLQTELLLLSGEPVYREAADLLSGLLPASERDRVSARILRRFRQSISLTRHFEEMLLISREGVVVLAMNPAKIGEFRGLQPYVSEGLRRAGVHVQTVSYSSVSEGLNSIVAVHPVLDDYGDAVGLICGIAISADLNIFTINRTGLGETGEIYLVAENGVLITPSRYPGFPPMKTFIGTDGVRAALEQRESGYGFYRDYRGMPVIGVYRWVPELRVVLLAEIDQTEAFKPIFTAMAVDGSIAFIAVAVAVAVAMGFARGLSSRLANLAETATSISRGELHLEAEVGRNDEIGSLAHAFNSMTNQLRGVIAKLEARVNELVHTQKALRESEKNYRSIFENAVEGVFQSTPEGRLISANSAFARIFGYDSPSSLIEEVTDVGKQLYVDPQDRDRLIRLLREKKEVTSFDTQLRKKDGGVVWGSLHARPIHDESGELVSLEGFLRDTTSERLAEEKLREQAEFLRAILESLTHPFYVLDAETFTVVIANSAATPQYSPEGTTCYALTHGRSEPCDTHDHVCPVREVVARGMPVTVEHTHTSPSGEPRYVELHAYPIFDAQGKVTRVIEYALDVTERKRLETQLRQSARMEAVGQMAGGIAHDFNNLITAITGYAAMVWRSLEDEDPNRDRILQISHAADKAADLTRQLLAFSRRQVLDVKVLDVNESITNIQQIIRRVVSENIEIVTALDSKLGHVKADPGQIEQIMMNLVVNARDAMPDGGTLTIETANVFLDEDYARAASEVQPGPYVTFSVGDTGIGMNAHTRARVFEPFFTTKGPGKGTGLGLSTVFGIVKQHQGHVTVYSEPGRGSVFKVYLPLVEGETDQPREPVERLPQPRGTETILLVEDEQIVREMAGELLGLLGYRVITAAEPGEAIRVAEQNDGNIDLLLTDVILPQMDGRSLFRRLSSRWPSVKVLFVSGYTENFIVHHGVLDPGVHFLHKPFTVDGLANKVREVLDE